ncbi:MAG: hypothetical protein M1832_005384 [Thelocarpon impressellum]|nr:MAG: hypothetical protein M1832_005384 [Thelocarpon impressellum]
MFRIPRPRSFLYLMSLRTGTELITLSLLLNKVSGIYGLLALLTGLQLSPLQLSMYLYSVGALILTALLAPHIRRQSPLQCLALAWFYILDSIVNAAYTAAFSLTWFLVLSRAHSDARGGSGVPSAGGPTMDEAAGFTSPEFNVSGVHVVAQPAAGLTAGQDAVAVAAPGGSNPTAAAPSLGHGVLMPESASSIAIITSLWLMRAYFTLVVMAYARSVLRVHMHSMSHVHLSPQPNGAAPDSANPFAAHTPDGQGWQGKLGRILVRIGRSYWLGLEEDVDGSDDDGWAAGMGGRFEKNRERGLGGAAERERRRRSGTGPPVPAPAEVQRAVVEGR